MHAPAHNFSLLYLCCSCTMLGKAGVIAYALHCIMLGIIAVTKLSFFYPYRTYLSIGCNELKHDLLLIIFQAFQVAVFQTLAVLYL